MRNIVIACIIGIGAMAFAAQPTSKPAKATSQPTTQPKVLSGWNLKVGDVGTLGGDTITIQNANGRISVTCRTGGNSIKNATYCMLSRDGWDWEKAIKEQKMPAGLYEVVSIKLTPSKFGDVPSYSIRRYDPSSLTTKPAN